MSSEITEKKCGACDQIKPIKQFYRNCVFKDGYDSRCKRCKREKIKIYKGSAWPQRKPQHKQKWEDFTRLVGVKKDDYVTMYEFMKKIGFDPNKVHEDFCTKYGLETRLRTVKNSNTWNYSEL